MNETRRPIVPGPGIAAQAVALREQKAQLEQKAREVFAEPAAPSPMEWEREQQAKRIDLPRSAPAILPFHGVGNLAKGIAGVMSEVGTISKSGYNKFHNYHYATLQDLLFALCPLMGKHGVVIMQNEVERSIAETRIMVAYEFSIFHTSGEIWPEKPRFTGMAIGRNTKGEWDDKAINKCHSAARKYFLLSLFQVPSGDFDDADEGPPQTKVAPQPAAPARRNVPGPPPKPPETVEAAPVSPYKIIAKEAGPEGWLAAYLTRISEAKDADEITKLDHFNDMILQKLSDDHPMLYNQIDVAIQARLAQLPAAVVPEDTMPDPLGDTQDSMNWIATKLAQTVSLASLEAFWNLNVAPQETAFDDMDWALLLQEFKRHEARLAKPVDDEPEPT